MTKRIRKAVFPVAGLGTRFLPATKSMPKELLPVVDKPLIQYAVEEAFAAGIEQIIFVSSRGKNAMEDHFDRSPELEETLSSRNKTEGLSAVQNATIDSGDIVFVRQNKPLGLGHAIWCARHVIGNEPFAVLLPDDIVLGDHSCIGQLVEAYKAIDGGNIIAVQEVAPEHTRMYGILDPEGDTSSRVFRAKGMVEKPEPDVAPSRIAAIGRYVLEPSIFAALDRKEIGAGNEIQLTDAIAAVMDASPLHGCHFDGTRYDCGDKLGFLKANIAQALRREDLADGLRNFMNDTMTDGGVS